MGTEAVGDRYALYDAATGKVHLLNETAALVWELADGAHTAGEIGQSVARLYGREPARVARDVGQILQQMRDEGLIEDRENG